jgi:hypothetical protein
MELLLNYPKRKKFKVKSPELSALPENAFPENVNLDA